jgi:2,3-dihydroxybenzoate decarboxylase
MNTPKIGVEEHLISEKFDTFLKKMQPSMVGKDFPNLVDPDRAKELGALDYIPFEKDRFPVMDRHNFKQILSIGGEIQRMTETSDAIKAARFANDVIKETVDLYPHRFWGLGNLPMQDPAAACEEIERCKALGFIGIMLHGSTCYHYYDEPQFEPFWAKLEALNMPLYLHVGNPEADQIRIYDGYDDLLGNTWNWGVVGGTHAMRIVFGGVFERHPNAKLILGHMGEGLPYWVGRIDEGYECRKTWKRGRISKLPSHYIHRNLYATTSGGFHEEAVVCALSGFGPDKLLFSTDYPHYPADTAVERIDSFRSITDEQKKDIYYRNTEKLFNIRF